MPSLGASPRSTAQLREVVLPELPVRTLGAVGVSLCVRPRSSTLRILPLIVLGSSPNSSRRTRLYADSWARLCAKIERAASGPGSTPATSMTFAFETASRSGSGEGTTAASATEGCSISTLSSSNGGDPVVRGLEDVVGAADVGQVALLVADRDVTGVVEPTAHRLFLPLRVAVVAGGTTHRSDRRRPPLNQTSSVRTRLSPVSTGSTLRGSARLLARSIRSAQKASRSCGVASP